MEFSSQEPAELNKIDSVSFGKIGNSLSKKIFPHTSSDKKLVTSGKLAKVPSSRSSLIFPRELEETNKRPFHFGVSEEILRPDQHLPPHPVLMSQKESTLMDHEVQKILQKGAIIPAQPNTNHFLILVFEMAEDSLSLRFGLA